MDNTRQFRKEQGLLDGSVAKNPLAMPETCRKMSAIPGLGRSPRRGNGNPLQNSCLGNPMDTEPGGLQSMGSQRAGHN